MFPEPAELLLIGCSTESIWIPKIQMKKIDTKNQLADKLTKGISHVMSGIIFCACSALSNFSSTVCSETMATRLQHDSSEERVTAKSRPMMSLIAKALNSVIFGIRKPGEEKL